MLKTLYQKRLQLWKIVLPFDNLDENAKETVTHNQR
jgi:hypothetical protein